MASKSAIEWTDSTWNPIRGCTRVSPGCGGPGNVGGCYAEAFAARFSKPGMPFAGISRMTPSGPRWTGKVMLVPEHLDDPSRWQKPRRIFVNSMSDLFHEKVPVSWIQSIFDVMLRVPRHQFQILTKRERRMAEVVPHLRLPDGSEWASNPARHVVLGVSVENQECADRRIPVLAATPAAVRFLSVEPLLEAVDLRGLLDKIHWCIVGEESGPRSRPMNIDWVRAIRDECIKARVPVFFKQARDPKTRRMVGLPLLDGRRWSQYPKQEACRA